MKRNYLITAILALTMLTLLVGIEQLFSRENLIVGIMFALTLVVVNGLDVHLPPFEMSAIVLGISLALGVITWVANLNIILTLICTFGVIFLATYYLFGDFHAPLFVPVVIGYLYLLFSPETADHLPMRFLALIFGASVMMLAWTIINHLKSRESTTALLDNLIGEVARYATATAGSSEIEFVPTPLDKLQEQIDIIDRRLYTEPVRSNEMSLLVELRISLVLMLERMILAISTFRIETDPSPIERQGMAELAGLLEDIRTSSGDLKQWRRIEPKIQEFSTTYRQLVDATHVDASPAMFEVVSAFDVLADQIERIRTVWAKDDIKRTEVSDMFWAQELARIVRPTSLRRRFALKFAITLTLAVLISHFVPIPLFTWTVLSIAFMMRPYIEETDTRSRDRVKSTFFGIGLFTLIFAVASNSHVLLLIGIGLQVISFLLKFNTYPQMIVSTAATLSLVALASNETGLMLSLERVAFVLLGAIIAMMVTRFIFPYRVTIANVDLVERSRHLSYLMLGRVLRNRLQFEQLESLDEFNEETRSLIKGTALAISMIEHQLRLNSQIREFEQVDLFNQEQRLLVNDIYFFFASFPHMPQDHAVIDRVMVKLENLISRIDAELVRAEGRNTRYGGPDFYDMKYSYLDELNALQRRIDAAFAYVDDEDTRLSLNALGTIVERIKMPFEQDWTISRLA